MSRKASPAAIGIFVFAGLALLTAGILLFTSTRLFSRSAEVIVYFDSSLNGLREGAPVKYRGVTIGEVTRTLIHFNQATNDTAMPVIFEVREGLIRGRLGSERVFDSLADLNEFVRKGLRARLETESLVTGVLYVDLELETSPPPPVYHQIRKRYLEVPSRPTEIQQLMKNLARMDFVGLEKKLSALLVRVDSVFEQLRINEITTSVTNVLNSVNTVVTSPDLTNSFVSLKSTLDEYRALSEKVRHRVDPLADGLTNALAQVNQTLVQTRGAMQNLRELLAVESPLRHDLTLVLEQLAEASQSVAAFADYLQSHPNALLTGRKVVPQKQ